MKNVENIHNGKIYIPMDEEILKDQLKKIDLLKEYNNSDASNQELRLKLLKNMLGDMGKDCYIEAPFYANFGGRNVHLGNHVYANFHLTCVDDTNIYIGDDTMIGPNVTIVTATHPVSPTLRKKGYQYNKEVHIGKNCFIGAGSIILPGVNIGDNSIIGAGSLVNKDVPSGVIVVGNPARILRKINENDEIYYDHDKLIDWEEIE